MENLIEIKGLFKKYGKDYILRNIDLNVAPGESIALIGHEGCGKSTLLKVICGLTSIQGGKIHYCGNLKFNYVPEDFPKLIITPRQYIKKAGMIEGLSKKEVLEKSNYYFEAFYMNNLIDTPIKFLHKSMMQKIGVIQAMLMKPDVLLLDEPLSGQDLESQKVLIKMVKELIKQDVAVIMSCDEKFLINTISDVAYEIINGKLIRRQVEKNHGEYDVITFENNNNEPLELEIIKAMVEKLEIEGKQIRICVNTKESNKLIRDMMNLGYYFRGMNSEII